MNQRNAANIGGPIFLAVIGAVMYFALSDTQVAGISLTTVGIILLVAAGLWLVLGLVMGRPRNTVTHESVQQHPGGTEREIRNEP